MGNDDGPANVRNVGDGGVPFHVEFTPPSFQAVAGEGINLQFCSEMVNYDIPFRSLVLRRRCESEMVW